MPESCRRAAARRREGTGPLTVCQDGRCRSVRSIQFGRRRLRARIFQAHHQADRSIADADQTTSPGRVLREIGGTNAPWRTGRCRDGAPDRSGPPQKEERPYRSFLDETQCSQAGKTSNLGCLSGSPVLSLRQEPAGCPWSPCREWRPPSWRPVAARCRVRRQRAQMGSTCTAG